jgi:octaprenyl-diphosphate synthase
MRWSRRHGGRGPADPRAHGKRRRADPDLARHLVDSGGKRLRPLLTLAAARLCGYRGIEHVKLAAAIEFIHTATLLHDDVVDASALRRGKSTANMVWGNKPSILVGDFLFSRAFQLMVDAGSMRVLRYSWLPHRR